MGLVSCWICGADAWRSAGACNGHPLLRCPGCGCVRRKELPTPEAWRERFTGPQGLLENQAVKKRRPRARLLEALGARALPGRLLDVGCGYGYFLKEARERGWTVQGVEVSAAERTHAREKLGLPVEDRFLEDLGAGDGSFDAVTFLEVVEFLPDLQRTLKEAHRLLSPGGTLGIRAYDGRFHRWALALTRSPLLRWAGFQAGIVHLGAYPPAALARAVEKCGFDRVETFPSPLTEGDPHAQGGRLGSWIVVAGKWGVGIFSRIVHALTGATLSSSYLLLARKPDPRKTVLHVITRLDPGGSSENVVLSAKGADPARFRSLAAAGGEPTRDAFHIPALSRDVRLFRDAAAFRRLHALFRALRPDVVHTHSSKAGFLGRWAAALAGVPRVVHTPHGHVFYGYFSPARARFYARVEALSAFVTDRLVALTPGEREESLAAGVGRRAQWTVIPSGTGWDEDVVQKRRLIHRRVRDALNIPPEAMVVGSVMRLEPVKGPAVLVEAMGEIFSPRETYFLLVGDGSERPRLEALRARLPDPSRLILLGHRDDPFMLMAAMDVYVQPSLNEGMGKTLVMAQAMGLPVVASRVCGVPDVVKEGETALLVPPNDPAALARALETLLGDLSLRRRLGDAGRARVTTPGPDGLLPFGAERMVKLLEELYASLF